MIVETCYLTEDEIRKVTKLVDAAGADFIKTSTGLGPRGANERDIELFKEESSRLRIKASGGIRDSHAAKRYVEMGAERIGTSAGV